MTQAINQEFKSELGRINEGEGEGRKGRKGRGGGAGAQEKKIYKNTLKK